MVPHQESGRLLRRRSHNKEVTRNGEDEFSRERVPYKVFVLLTGILLRLSLMGMRSTFARRDITLSGQGIKLPTEEVEIYGVRLQLVGGN